MNLVDRLRESLVKRDKFGQEIKPGALCIRNDRKEQIEFCIYKGATRGNNATGKYGRFITMDGKVSIRYSSVVFIFEPSSDRRTQAEEITKLMRSYYEGA